MTEGDGLQAVPEDWQRALAVVAHPDDLEYGAASAIAKWTSQGKWVGYVMVTKGEAGIDGINVVPVTQPTGFTEFVDLVVPELQRRGRARTAYAGETLREHLFGQGQKRLLPDHVAHQTLPPWKRKSSTNKAAE